MATIQTTSVEIFGTGVLRDAHGARDTTPVRIYPPMAGARSRDVGQSMYDALRHGLRRSPLGSRYAACDAMSDIANACEQAGITVPDGTRTVAATHQGAQSLSG